MASSLQYTYLSRLDVHAKDGTVEQRRLHTINISTCETLSVQQPASQPSHWNSISPDDMYAQKPSVCMGGRGVQTSTWKVQVEACWSKSAQNTVTVANSLHRPTMIAVSCTACLGKCSQAASQQLPLFLHSMTPGCQQAQQRTAGGKLQLIAAMHVTQALPSSCLQRQVSDK